MWKHGPRNLLEVSRRTGIPFTSVYHRVGKLEAEAGRVAHLIPKVSSLGMSNLTVQIAARPGFEDDVTKALKIPGWWQSITSSEAPFTHHSTHAVPVKFTNEFRKYLRRLIQMRLATQIRVIPTGNSYPNFPNFSYYNASSKEWRFEWDKWISGLKRHSITRSVEDPSDYHTAVDKRDLLIVQELQNNARATFADMAPVLGISLQGVKYHYDKKLVPSGIVKNFGFDVVPYPNGISAQHIVSLTFANKPAMNRFFSAIPELFFVEEASKALKSNTLIIRTYVPQTQVRSMLAFFSELAKARLLHTYSTVRLNPADTEVQTIQPDLFVNQHGWVFDSRRYNSQLSKLR